MSTVTTKDGAEIKLGTEIGDSLLNLITLIPISPD